MKSCVVLMYHVVDQPRSSRETRLCCPPESFAEQMDYLQRRRYSVISLSELANSLRENISLPERAVVLTFDDGSACTYEQAMPILRKYRYPATVFVISGLLGKNNEWLRDAGFPERRMLNADEIRALEAERFDIGSHTVTHQWLARIPLSQARAEIRNSKAQLEDVLGHEVAHFAYPFGSYTPEVRDAVVEAGYRAACSTRWGKKHSGFELFDLRRVEIQGKDSLLQFVLKLHAATHNMPPVPEARHLIRRGLEGMGLLRKRVSERA
jgi:peptidoglycan/xylan/chitin deacetylase (PgdA/CDA1 family)